MKKILIGFEETLKYDNHFTIETDLNEEAIDNILDEAERTNATTEDLLLSLVDSGSKIVDEQIMDYSSPIDNELVVHDVFEQEDK